MVVLTKAQRADTYLAVHAVCARSSLGWRGTYPSLEEIASSIACGGKHGDPLTHDAALHALAATPNLSDAVNRALLSISHGRRRSRLQLWARVVCLLLLVALLWVLLGPQKVNPPSVVVSRFEKKKNSTVFCNTTHVVVRTSTMGDVAIGFREDDTVECHLRRPHGTKEIVIEIGTNSFPAHLADVVNVTSVFFVGVEPIPHQYVALTKTLEAQIPGRYAAFPNAMSDGEGDVAFNLAKISTCSSLLPMKNANFGRCTARRAIVLVPRLTIDALLDALPPALPVTLLTIDAQGFDLYVAATLRANAMRVHNVVIECQDLKVGDPLIMYPGAKTCGEALHCMSWKWHFDFIRCIHNTEKMDRSRYEMNCHFVNRRVDKLVPYELKCANDDGWAGCVPRIKHASMCSF